MSGIAWVNGEIGDLANRWFGVLERGFIYGDGVFETLRLRDGFPQDWDDHLRRLCQGCLALKIPYSRDDVEAGVAEVAARIGNGVLRVTVTRGESPRGLLPYPDSRPTVVVVGQGEDPYPGDLYERGIHACLISFPRNPHSPLVRIKSLNCLENILGRMEAAAAGAQEGLFCNIWGEVAEGTTSNVFFVIKERIVTPSRDSGLLSGIMRARVIFLAKELGIPVTEGRVLPGEFLRVQEAFLTNSLMGIMPLVSVDGRKVGKGIPGPVTDLLHRRLEFP